jgi:methylphosphotriester-DNA--protein-cysteine methyltransferase
LCTEQVGLPPKAAAAIFRLEQALRQLRHRPDVGWTSVAATAGHADQPYLVRDYRRFTGSPPGRFLTSARAVPAAAMTRPQRTSGWSRAPAGRATGPTGHAVR